MKRLFDQNLSFRLVGRLADLFPLSDQVRRLGLDTADDRAIWDHARVHDFIIVTQDADSADLAALRGAPPKVIWLRCGNQATRVIEQVFRTHASTILAFESDPGADCLELA